MKENKEHNDENVDELENKEENLDENLDKEKELEEDADEKEKSDDESSDENEKLKESFLRLQADYTNFRRRTEKEKSDIYKYASESLVTKLLNVLDNFDRAFDEVQDEDKDDAFVKGVELIKNDLDSILENEGLELIDSDNQKFDPNLHHAVFLEKSDDVESEHIIETYQKGYKLNDKVIRPAMVKVSE